MKKQLLLAILPLLTFFASASTSLTYTAQTNNGLALNINLLLTDSNYQLGDNYFYTVSISNGFFNSGKIDSLSGNANVLYGYVFLQNNFDSSGFYKAIAQVQRLRVVGYSVDTLTMYDTIIVPVIWCQPTFASQYLSDSVIQYINTTIYLNQYETVFNWDFSSSPDVDDQNPHGVEHPYQMPKDTLFFTESIYLEGAGLCRSTLVIPVLYSWQTTGINEIQNNEDVLVYTIGKQLIIKSKNVITSLNIYNMIGQSVMKLNPNESGQINIAVPNLASGIYIVSLKTNSNIVVNKKIVLQ